MIEKIQSQRTYRYAVSGNKTAKNLLYVLHGYGQLAPYFIRKFNSLEDYFIVAPEGMHRFYFNGSSGRVGACWMTKEERLDDIEDNCNWLYDLHSKITGAQSYDKIIILGFSQGGATAARWFYDKRMHADHLIMWASVFPPDLSPEDLIDQHSTNNFFVLGTEDEYFDVEQQKEAIDFYSIYGFRTISYHGKHDICIETLVDSLNHLK
jgi:predicted esterase